MNKIAQIDHEIWIVAGTAFDRHVQCSLAKKGLTVWRHVTQIINDNKHLHHRLVWIKQRLKHIHTVVSIKMTEEKTAKKEKNMLLFTVWQQCHFSHWHQKILE